MMGHHHCLQVVRWVFGRHAYIQHRPRNQRFPITILKVVGPGHGGRGHRWQLLGKGLSVADAIDYGVSRRKT
jgi:hypothetical protein